MNKPKVLIFIVCYNHEKLIIPVLQRIQPNIWKNDRFDTEILIIDDKSTDNTFSVAKEYAEQNKDLAITVLFNPVNQGYGGNQKIGYQYAIENDFDLVVLLHGDGQYPPEYLEQMILPILDGDSDVVLGSRMVDKKSALKGRMPYYKWIGNVTLTFLQNAILGVHLAEFHTGYKSYSVSSLKSIPFEYNSDYFDFDTDILIQFFDTKKRIKEIPIPTYYGDEISNVDVFKYGFKILYSSMNSRLMNAGIFYHPKFDYIRNDNTYYTLKLGYTSPHQLTIDRIKEGERVLDIGCGPGYMAEELSKKSVKTISLDYYISESTKKHSFETIQGNVETIDYESLPSVDSILLLDIIEHLNSPEELLKKIRNRYCLTNTNVIISTGNVAFLPIRLMLLLGYFNYGKRGILDLDHSRLFTFSSLKTILRNSEFEILSVEGIPAPFPLSLGNHWFSRALLQINKFFIKLSKGLFSYQMFFVVRPKATLKVLLDNAYKASK